MENTINLYNNVRKTNKVIKDLRQKNQHREAILREKALRVAKRVINEFPIQYKCINYSLVFTNYMDDEDDISMIDVNIDYESDFVKISTYCYKKKALVPLFSFPCNFIWENLIY